MNMSNIPKPIGRNTEKMKVAKKNFLTLKCTKISDHLSREQQGPSPEMFNTRLEESLKKNILQGTTCYWQKDGLNAVKGIFYL